MGMRSSSTSPKIQKLLTRAVDAHKSDNLEDAKQLYIEILGIDVKHAKSLYGLALIAHFRGNLDGAARLLERAVASNPNDFAFHRSQGTLLVDQGKAREAIAAYKNALRLSPNDEQAHYEIAKAYALAGELMEAEGHYKRAIELRPTRGASYEFLSGVLQRQGKFEEAGASSEQALAAAWNDMDALQEMGERLVRAGNTETAARCFARTLVFSPNKAEAHNGLGVVRADEGNLEEAEASYLRALACKPAYPEALCNLGAVARKRGKTAEARQLFEGALQLRPDLAEAHCNLGLLLLEEKDSDSAKRHFERALEVDPKSVIALQHLGNLWFQNGDPQAAKKCFEKAIALAPDQAEGHNGMGAVLQEEGNLDEAEASYRRALACKPNFAPAYCNLGNIAKKRGALAEAMQHYEHALALDHGLAEAHSNRGLILVSERRLEEARAQYERAIALEGATGNTRWNRCLLDLLEGNLEAGWQGYETRRSIPKIAPRVFSQPTWRGEPLNGARILLHAEQGLGDTLQFLRYVPMVHAAGGTVILDVKPPIVRLAKQLPGVAEVIASGDPLPEFEWQCPLMSLPVAFKTTLESIHAETLYLRVPEEARLAAEQVQLANGVLRVGLVWSGNPEFPEDRLRSMHLSAFAPVMQIENARFFSLQFGPAAPQVEAYRDRVVDLTPSIKDFADTAALLTRMDLLISVDTAVAHLAGALAKPVWTLLPFASDWRWLLNRDDSPWYPTMRLFRQTRPEDWGPVIERVCAELSLVKPPETP